MHLRGAKEIIMNSYLYYRLNEAVCQYDTQLENNPNASGVWVYQAVAARLERFVAKATNLSWD